ncbi:MAG: VWA domain-containing protein [Lachnospiraceae bacterium]|nr:VWA domain-containing protein [Lachnospiraceae bacterium]
MKKTWGMKLGMLIVGCAMVANTTIAMAAPSVSETKDNISITKSAEWTQLDGKPNDASGNPYAKVSFKIDATNAPDQVVNVVSKAGDADIIIVLDNSGSMGAEFQAAKDAAADFAAQMIDTPGFNVRVGLVTMGSTGIRAVDFTSDKNKITTAIRTLQFDPVMWGTNFQEALYEAQLMLGESRVKNKLIVFQSDGVPEQCYKTVNCTTKTGADIALGANDSECAINQTNIIKSKFSDVGIATIGYTHATSNHSVLKEMCTKDTAGNKMFFEATARAQVTATLGNLANAFKSTERTFSQIITGNTLVDKVPDEYEIIESTIKSNDSTVTGKVDSAKNTVTFTWGQKLEKKVYELSFIIKLKKSKVPAEYISAKKEVYTNGTTIDVTKDSSGSAVFNYSISKQIPLKSPTLQLNESLFKVQSGAPIIENPEEGAPTVENPDEETPGAGTPGTDCSTPGAQTGSDLGTDETPKTADAFNMNVLFIMAAMAVVGGVTAVIIRKRRAF